MKRISLTGALAIGLMGCADGGLQTTSATAAPASASHGLVAAAQAYCLPTPKKKAATVRRLLADGFAELPDVFSPHDGYSVYAKDAPQRLVVELIENREAGFETRRCTVTGPGSALHEVHDILAANSELTFRRRDLSARTTVYDYESSPGVGATKIQIAKGSDVGEKKPAGQQFANTYPYIEVQRIK